MRKRVLIGGIATAFAVLAIALAIAAGLFIRRFDAIEAIQTRQKAEQILRAVEADLNQLAISNRDYAQWDDAHRFIRQRDPQFLITNFSVDSLAGMEVDVVALLDPDGAPLHSSESFEGQKQITSPARPELLQVIEHLRRDSSDWRAKPAIGRLIGTSLGPLAFSAVEVTRSDKSDPTGALLLFGRFLDPDELDRVAQTSQMSVTSVPINGNTPGPGALPPVVRAWIAAADAAPVFGWNVDDEHTISYALLRDVHGKPALLLSAPSTRDIAILGRRTTWMLMGTIALLLAACGAAVALFALRLKQSWEAQVVAERRHRAAVDHLGEHDSLTELPNRVYLRTRLPQLLADTAASHRTLAVLYIDVDNFKNINESQNHATGDQLLKVVAQRLKAVTGPADMVVRSGGDEFVVVAPLLDDMLAIRVLASRVLAAVREPIVLDDMTVSTTASIGVAVFPSGGHDTEALLKQADIALYRAKELGRDNFQLFDAGMDAELSEHVVIEQALRRAIGTEQIYLEFQPLVELHSGMLTSFEALARWRHPEMGVIPPARFIPVAEKSGLIVALGEQIARLVVAQQHEWQQAGVPLVPVAINVAPLQFERTNFSTLVHELALQFDLDPRWLSFEVTESGWMQDSNKHVVTIDTLRHAGSKVYIDDFGTGFSNLSYLKNLPVDAVKIDQAFVRNIDVDPSDATIVRGILAMARQLNLDTIAEGIETVGQLNCLREMGCHIGQGYYFSKPVPALQCRALLEQMGELRRFTETLKGRALRCVSNQDPAAAA